MVVVVELESPMEREYQRVRSFLVSISDLTLHGVWVGGLETHTPKGRMTMKEGRKEGS